MSEVRFTRQAQVVLDAEGNGTVSFSPRGTRWRIDGLTVKVSTRVKESTVRVYNGYIGDAYYVDGTFSGSSGDTSDTTHHLEDGQTLVVVWTGGDPGETASCFIRGWENVMGGGFRAV